MWAKIRLEEFSKPKIHGYSFEFPIKRLGGSHSNNVLKKVIENVFSMAFGLTEYFEESQMVILYQCNRIKEAKTFCNRKSNHFIGKRDEKTVISQNFTYYLYKSTKTNLENYSSVYDASFVEFFRRYTFIYDELCVQSSPKSPKK